MLNYDDKRRFKDTGCESITQLVEAGRETRKEVKK